LIEDLESVHHIDLYHEELPIYVHIDIYRYNGAKMIRPYWGAAHFVTDSWFTTSIFMIEDIDSRTTWNDDSHPVIGYETRWDHPNSVLEDKIIAYHRSGYKIANVVRYGESV
jgi:hypothetical protein